MMSSSENQRGKKSSTARTEEELRSALIGWTDFKEVETRIGPYVSKVIKKARQQNGGYGSASEVLEDYKFFHRLLAKLTHGKDMLPVPTFAAEYFCCRADLRKAEMLSAFSAMQTDSTNKIWISKQLKEAGDPDELRENTNEFITRLDTMVEKLDQSQKVKDEISNQVDEKLKLKPLCKYQVVQNDFEASVQNFNDLKLVISDEEELLELLSERSSTYLEILAYVERNSTDLEDKFYQCLRDDEHDLADQFREVYRSMEAVTKKEREFEQEARTICETERLRVLLASGLKF